MADASPAALLHQAADHARFSPAHIRLAADGLHLALAQLLDAIATTASDENAIFVDEALSIARHIVGDDHA
ncbi:hypothetical protein [Streptomyces cucumeris]|uniref:hypothetical protein n=1 Tax=Streptomyces cucumeris TaxID=2962890 RepID=UPI0020C8CD15|nr:hypothetical protein [Streptomyces sp. NEAU-Y11]MCP9209523.1 hypothetical protein [Streptomyces sp. NEAU-Y11]